MTFSHVYNAFLLYLPSIDPHLMPFETFHFVCAYMLLFFFFEGKSVSRVVGKHLFD